MIEQSQMNFKIDFLSEIYTNTQNMIKMADNKANLSILIHGILISLVTSTTILSGAFNKIDNLQNQIQTGFIVIFFFFLLYSFLGILCSIHVYKARGSHGNEIDRIGMMYFGQISQFKSDKAYIFHVNKLDESDIINEYGRQIYQISRIAKEKMICVNYSILFLRINLFLGLITMGLMLFLNLGI